MWLCDTATNVRKRRRSLAWRRMVTRSFSWKFSKRAAQVTRSYFVSAVTATMFDALTICWSHSHNWNCNLIIWLISMVWFPPFVFVRRHDDGVWGQGDWVRVVSPRIRMTDENNNRFTHEFMTVLLRVSKRNAIYTSDATANAFQFALLSEPEFTIRWEKRQRQWPKHLRLTMWYWFFKLIQLWRSRQWHLICPAGLPRFLVQDGYLQGLGYNSIAQLPSSYILIVPFRWKRKRFIPLKKK